MITVDVFHNSKQTIKMTPNQSINSSYAFSYELECMKKSHCPNKSSVNIQLRLESQPFYQSEDEYLQS